MGFGHGVDGSGVLATVSFKLIGGGSTSIEVEKAFVTNVNPDDLCPCLAHGATIDITAPTSPPKPTLTSTATATPRPICTGDVNGDGLVNVRDLVLVARRMGTRVGERRYDARFDLNRDGRINVRDLMIVIRRLGAICR
jgi:Dockerin type I domain